MKIELSTTMAGDLSLEIIAETDLECTLLKVAWKANGYPTGYGKSKTPGGGVMGFYIRLCRLLPPEPSEKAQ